MRQERVLIVDDDPLVLEILDGLLGDSYELTTAASGEEALETAVKLQPDLVLMDVMMDGIDGYETCRRMRELECLKSTKIILVSGNMPGVGQPSAPAIGDASGPDDYLVKPFDFAQLFEKVEGVLQR